MVYWYTRPEGRARGKWLVDRRTAEPRVPGKSGLLAGKRRFCGGRRLSVREDKSASGTNDDADGAS